VFPGFKRHDLAIQLCRIQLLTLVLGAGAAVFSAALHARRRFVQPELAQALGQAACLAVLGLTISKFGVVGTAWAFVVRGAVQMAFLIFSLGIGKPVSLPKELLGRFWDRWKPLLAGTGIYKTEPLVDSFLSSMAGPGGLALYYLGQRLYGAALEVVRKGFAEPVLPVLSIRAGEGDERAFRALYRRRIVLILTFVLPAYGLFVLAGKPVLQLLIGRGGVTPENVHTLWVILVALGGVFVGGAAGQIVAFAWYARGDTRTTTAIGVSTFVVAVGLKVAAFWKFGIVGLAVASSVHYLGTGLVSFFILERRIAWRTRPA
jgi:putative peptidoglycan lipid II flippase